MKYEKVKKLLIAIEKSQDELEKIIKEKKYYIYAMRGQI